MIMLNFYFKAKGLGRRGYQFRMPSGIGAAILLLVHHIENNIVFTWVDYFTIVVVLIIPHIYLYQYVKSGNDKGLAFKQIKYDLLLCGWVAGSMDLSVMPSVLYTLAILTTYVAVRGFNKLHRILLIPLGALLAVWLQGFHLHLQSTDLMNYLGLSYMVIHFTILSYVSYLFAKHQYLDKIIIQDQKDEINEKSDEISVQSEELKSLNESLLGLNQNLEKKVLERTQLLEIKNKKLSEYAYINAHKLRAPVASILGLIQFFDYKKVLNNNGDEISVRLKKSAAELNIIVKEIRVNLEKEDLINTTVKKKNHS